tara:strand:+ start:176871 stop:177647 length:777 start_codon:yes stop_codon:yes gene_type:complete
MKSFFVVAGLSTALLAAAPMAAQAQLFAHAKQGGSYGLTITKTQIRTGHDYNSYRPQRGSIMPIGKVVRELERRSGATVTDINLAKNGKVYNFEGVTARGFIVEAKADAYTGQVKNVKFTKFRPKYDPKGMPINKLLADLRNEGFRHFDLVSLKDQRGVYVVRGLNRNGQPVRIEVKAKNGKIISKTRAANYNGPAYARANYRDFDDLRQGLASKKYSGFTNVVAYDDYYETDARDNRGRQVQLLINAFTGAILSANR